MTPYRLDREIFKMQKAEDTEHNYSYWKNQSLSERLRAAFYLNSVAFNFDINNPPKMDKNYFKMRSRK